MLLCQCQFCFSTSAYCAANDKTKCTADGTRCIPNDWWCDKYPEGPDCAGGEDENDCSGLSNKLLQDDI